MGEGGDPQGLRPNHYPPHPAHHKGANAIQIFGQWFIRKDGWLALGPMDQAKAQDHADRMNTLR